MKQSIEKYKLKDLKSYEKNPRRLSEKQYESLKRDLIELGDLSGVIHDLNSNQIIGGNQRTRIFNDLKNAEIYITEKFKVPTKTGTVALGYIIFAGEKYTYRQVRWTSKQCEKANIVANKAGGNWDMDILANDFEIEDLKEWGFEDIELGFNIDKINDESDNEHIDLEEQYKIVVDCKNKKHQSKLLKQFAEMGIECKIL